MLICYPYKYLLLRKDKSMAIRKTELSENYQTVLLGQWTFRQKNILGRKTKYKTILE